MFNRVSAGAIAGGVIGGVAVIAIIAVAIIVYRRRSSGGSKPAMFYSSRSPPEANDILPFHTSETSSITHNHSSQNLVSLPRTSMPNQQHEKTVLSLQGYSLQPRTSLSNQVTDEQVQSVRQLHSMAVPSHALAVQSSTGHPEDYPNHRRSTSESSDAPPSYDML